MKDKSYTILLELIEKCENNIKESNNNSKYIKKLEELNNILDNKIRLCSNK